MADFLSVVALYYLCDALAASRHLSMDETLQCGRTYDTVRSYFVTEFDLAPHGTPERIAQMRQGYLGFQAWEEANTDRVEQMRAEAWLTVRGLNAARG